MRFGRLTVVRKMHLDTGRNKLRWVCQCDCGGATTTTSNRLTSGHTRSCGCYMRDRSSEAMTLTNAKRKPKHGLAGTRVWKTWHAMHRRCSNPKDIGFKNYGGRGITVCDAWFSIETFLADMGHPPDGCSIERIDNDMGYSKENCKWATKVEQSNNRRCSRRITFEGETLTAAQWAKALNVSYSRFKRRLDTEGDDVATIKFFKLGESK